MFLTKNRSTYKEIRSEGNSLIYFTKMERVMPATTSTFYTLLNSCFAFSGLSSDSSSSKDGTTADKQTTSSSGTGSKILIICLVLVGVVLLSFSLFKFWQKKKREEQYARLLKLFEQDDELELELGLRD
ncbi:hypothetical protein C3L33_19784, partial [Rhododendron williamsianum]